MATNDLRALDARERLAMAISREEAIAWPPNRSLKVVAGAGTGKTRFLMERFLHLVLQKQIPANRILGLTFTRKAAQELEERIREGLGATGDSDELHIHTFDSFWLQLLLNYPAESQIEEPVLILDNGLSSLLQRKIVEEIKQDAPELLLASFRHINLTNLPHAVSVARSIVHSAKLRLLSSDQISPELQKLREKSFPTDPNKELATETISFIEGVAQLEKRLLVEANAHDYGDILLRAFKLLTSNLGIRERVKKRYRHILIDEAQDTNFGQFALLKYIAADGFTNMTIVGDVRQSIFGFRDANPKSLQDFEASTCTLGKNYRSYQPMLDLAVRVLEKTGEEGIHSLKAEKSELSQPTVAGFVTDIEQEENSFICNLIRKAIDKGIKPCEIAVLARTRATL
ncbi:ATP-dependent helicase, partial [bacterium]|nr:ATP-dependent helicase [bacterium]